VSNQSLIRSALTTGAGLFLGITSATGQEIPKPLPSTPNPGGGLVAPDEADGVVPAEDVDRPPADGIRPARPGIDELPEAEPLPTRPRQVVPAAGPNAPMTAEDLQTWQQIATLHEQFVRSQVPGASNRQNISRTDPNRERLQRLWERLAEIERQLILSGAYNDAIDREAVVRVRPIPRRDLDEVPDPLTASNQRVKSTENDRDTATARALAQEDRSPPPDPVIRRETLREAARQDPLTAEAVADTIERVDGVGAEVTPPPGDPNHLWLEFVEVRRQILIAEIAAARAVAREP
jgi:hypothetical protein